MNLIATNKQNITRLFQSAFLASLCYLSILGYVYALYVGIALIFLSIFVVFMTTASMYSDFIFSRARPETHLELLKEFQKKKGELFVLRILHFCFCALFLYQIYINGYVFLAGMYCSLLVFIAMLAMFNKLNSNKET